MYWYQDFFLLFPFWMSFPVFRVPAVYLTSASLWFFSILLFRGIVSSKLRSINPPEGFDSHPGHQFFQYFGESVTLRVKLAIFSTV